jgi:hypothetical protein
MKQSVCLYVLSIITIVAGIFYSTHATPLSGEITGTITKAQSPYLVERDLVVPVNKACTIEPGCIFLFKAFTGIKVYGTLKVNGLVDSLVVFTSATDRTFNGDTSRITDNTPVAAAFDWNGMDIMEQSVGSTISNASFWYTVNGIYARTEKIDIVNCFFNFTGNIDVRIGDKPFAVTQGTPFSYHPPKVEAAPLVITQQPQPGSKLVIPKKTVKIGCIILCAAGIAAGAVFGSMAANDYHMIQEMEPGSSFNPTGETVNINDYNDMKKRYRQRRNTMIGALSAGTGGAAGWLITLYFK